MTTVPALRSCSDIFPVEGALILLNRLRSFLQLNYCISPPGGAHYFAARSSENHSCQQEDAPSP